MPATILILHKISAKVRKLGLRVLCLHRMLALISQNIFIENADFFIVIQQILPLKEKLIAKVSFLVGIERILNLGIQEKKSKHTCVAEIEKGVRKVTMRVH